MIDRSINERFRQFLENAGKIDEPSAYKKLHITPQKWSNYKEGVRPITRDDLIGIVGYFKQLNARWLLTNEGEMIIQGKSSQAEKSINHEQTTPPYKCKICEEKDKQIYLMEMLIDEFRRQRDMDEERRRSLQGESSGGVEMPGKTG